MPKYSVKHPFLFLDFSFLPNVTIPILYLKQKLESITSESRKAVLWLYVARTDVNGPVDVQNRHTQVVVLLFWEVCIWSLIYKYWQSLCNTIFGFLCLKRLSSWRNFNGQWQFLSISDQYFNYNIHPLFLFLLLWFSISSTSLSILF